jgi:hypothetical protein
MRNTMRTRKGIKTFRKRNAFSRSILSSVTQVKSQQDQRRRDPESKDDLRKEDEEEERRDQDTHTLTQSFAKHAFLWF